jgi:hypothetical protein
MTALATISNPTSAHFTESQGQATSDAAPLLSQMICGKGTYLLTLYGQSVGKEDFEIKCTADGYNASAHTDFIVPGQSQSLDTTVNLDSKGIPFGFTVKGTAAGTKVNQEISLKDGTATIVTDSVPQTIPYTIGSSVTLGNIFYLFQLIAGRYDVKRGGEQQIPLFPNTKATLHHVGRDQIQAGVIAAGVSRIFDRYTFKLGTAQLILFADARGRVAAITVPAQKFIAVLDEYRDVTDQLLAKSAEASKIFERDYSAPAGAPFTAEEVTIQRDGFKLAGTLLLPKNGKKPFPAVVTSTGSGQQTRDEPLPIPGLEKYALFRQTAEALVRRGIAVLRVDDRGVGGSTGLNTLEKATTFDYADDVRAQIAFLRTRSDIDAKRIAIVGHSEGGMIAPLVAATDSKLAGIVLLAGPGKRGVDIMRFQLNQPMDIDPNASEEKKTKNHEENEKILKTVLEGGDTSKLPVLFRYPWTKAFMEYDPIPTIKKLRQPILILQGGLDHQITPDQANLLEQAARVAGNKSVSVKVFPTLNHLFLPAKTGLGSEYSSLSTSSVGDDVLNTIGDWLARVFRLR